MNVTFHFLEVKIICALLEQNIWDLILDSCILCLTVFTGT